MASYTTSGVSLLRLRPETTLLGPVDTGLYVIEEMPGALDVGPCNLRYLVYVAGSFCKTGPSFALSQGQRSVLPSRLYSAPWREHPNSLTLSGFLPIVLCKTSAKSTFRSSLVLKLPKARLKFPILVQTLKTRVQFSPLS